MGRFVYEKPSELEVDNSGATGELIIKDVPMPTDIHVYLENEEKPPEDKDKP